MPGHAILLAISMTNVQQILIVSCSLESSERQVSIEGLPEQTGLWACLQEAVLLVSFCGRAQPTVGSTTVGSCAV